MLGLHRRLFRLCENVTDLPNQGFFPQMSQTAAIGVSRLPGARTTGSTRATRRSPRAGGAGRLRGSVPCRRRRRCRRPEEHGDRLTELAERRLDRIRHVEDARERHLELLHEHPGLGSRVQDVDPQELHAVTELGVRGHSRGISSRHGGHHEPQKLTSRGCPRARRSRWKASGSDAAGLCELGEERCLGGVLRWDGPCRGGRAGSLSQETRNTSPAMSGRSRREVIRGW